MESKSFVKSLEITVEEPWHAELKRYMNAICSSPCPVTLEAAVSYQVAKQKMTRIGRCLKTLNKLSEAGEYESEEGVANIPRVQRRYLLRSMESGLQSSHKNHSYFLSTVREEVTPPKGTKMDPYFHELLVQWYMEKADEAAQELLAKWNDPVVRTLDPVVTKSDAPVVSTPAVVGNTTRGTPSKRGPVRTPSYSDDESGSDKASSTDEED